MTDVDNVREVVVDSRSTIDEKSGFSLITREEIDGLAKVDWEFVRVSEEIRDAALAYLQSEPPIDAMLDGKNRAQAIGEYITRKVQAREAKLEAQNNIAEIRIRYERELGKLIQKMMADGELASQINDRPIKGSDIVSDLLTLPDIGITHKQSSRWQAMADLPAEQFEEHIAEVKENGWELTTAAIVEHGTNHAGKNKPKTNRVGDPDVPQGFDACQTPAYAVVPLMPYLKLGAAIWESAAGEGLLVDAMNKKPRSVIATDILTGHDFFRYEPENYDVQVTNPPYSIKYKWLERCYILGKPFALLLPVETLGASTAQVLFKQYGLEVIFLDKRVNFKMPNVGFDGSAAQFPVAWFTWKLDIHKQITFAEIERDNDL